MKLKSIKLCRAIIVIFTVSLISFSCKDSDKKEKSEMASNMSEETKPFFKLSLAQWSLHKAIQNNDMDPLDFAEKAKEFGFEGLEYVSQLYTEAIEEKGMDSVLSVLKSNSEKFGMQNVLIMVDGEGNMASTNDAERNKAVQNHYKWVDAAAFLGCHSIRVNAHGNGTAEEVSTSAVDGLSKLSEYAAEKGINVLVENHGGYTSNGEWLANVMKRVNKSNCGTLPDFGNFCQTIGYGSINDPNCKDPYDIYKGLTELMPFAKAVSAKSYDFDENGNQPKIDYLKMMQIVQDAGYTGFVGVEYEGSNKSEKEGIELTRDLLLKVGKELSN